MRNATCYSPIRMPTINPAGQSEILLAANRLPVCVEETQWGWHLTESPGGLVSALKGTDLPFSWVGWPGREVPARAHATVREHLASLQSPFSLDPVFLTRSDTDLYYNGFSNRVIWPAFHGLKDHVHFRQEYWSAYRKTNETFAHRLFHRALHQLTRQVRRETIRVWIHDYQLLLAPRILRRMLEKAHLESEVRIGFFLHIPFPPFDDLRAVPPDVRNKLLDGLLGADLLGMHDAEYRGDFIHSCVESLGSEVWGNEIRDGARSCVLGVYPIGITPSQFSSALAKARTDGTYSGLARRYAGRALILGVDRLDPAKGLLEKLEAYRLFLEARPEAAAETCLLQVAVPSRTGIPEYRDLAGKLREKAAEINGRFTPEGAPPPVEIRYESLAKAELSSLYRLADIILITSRRDGMNLVSLESAACQRDRERAAALVLSRGTGAARWLSGALKVSPSVPAEIARALERALDMPNEERNSRARSNLAYVETRTAERWANRFLEDLSDVPLLRRFPRGTSIAI